MSASNGVIRIGRKGLKKFAFGEDGPPFEVDVVVAFQGWIAIDEEFRTEDAVAQDGTPYKRIPTAAMNTYHEAAREYVARLSTVGDTNGESPILTVAEALDFIARLREEYDELADFFRPKRRSEDESPGTSGAGLVFSEEGENSPPSTN